MNHDKPYVIHLLFLWRKSNSKGDETLQFDMKGTGRKRDVHLEKIVDDFSLESSKNPKSEENQEDEDDLLALMDKAN